MVASSGRATMRQPGPARPAQNGRIGQIGQIGQKCLMGLLAVARLNR